MSYKGELDSAKLKLALSVNKAIPKNSMVNISVYEKMATVVAFFLWYQKKFEEEVQVEFSNRALAPHLGDLHVSVFSIESHDKETSEYFREMLSLADVFEISENCESGIDIDLTFHELYIPYCDEN